jgi:Ca2+-binding RTX toxin-like protein
MTTLNGNIKFGMAGRNERFSFAWSIDGDDGNDLIATNSLFSVQRFVTFVGGKGNDIIQAYRDGGFQVGNTAGAVIFGDTGREADMAAKGSGPDHILGFAGTDTIFAGGGDDYVNGHIGDDDIYGGAGSDHLMGGYGADHIAGDAGDDVIYGGTPGSVSRAFLSIVIDHNGDDDTHIGLETRTGVAGQMAADDASLDMLDGGAGNDYLFGGLGADRMSGGLGNDTIIVDNAADKVFEAAGQGADTVLTSVSYTLAAGQHVDILATLQLTGTAAISLAGNELAQRINGNNGTNSINAGAGNDTLYGYGGNDTLSGGTGADRISGGVGNDVCYVDNVADKVFEAAGQGTDTVYASVSYTLAAGQHVETLGTTLLAGTGAISLAGNELAQKINGNNGKNGLYGNGGSDSLFGHGGSDLLAGGTGNDTLTGGAGSDFFVFTTALSPATNFDRITDFSVPADTIRLDNAVMAGLGATLGALGAGKFWKSKTGLAYDADDRIIYATDTGKLYYDANGNAAGGAVHFATLAPNLALTNADFVVI